MSYRVDSYSLSGGGSIDWVPGVVPAAWGGPWRAWRAVRAAPKTRNWSSTRVINPTRSAVLLEDDHPKHLQSSANLSETRASTWLRGRRAARADRARRKGRAPARPPRACSWRPRDGCDDRRKHGKLFFNLQPTSWLAAMRCRGEHHIVPMCPVLPLIPSGRHFTCLPSLSCAGTVLRGLVAAFPDAARLDDLELLLEEGVADERDSSAGGAPHVQDGRWRAL